ncbi:MAG: PP0621 family protein [Burkholderiales bacterium]
MGRLIVLILVVVLAAWLIRRALRASRRGENPQPQAPVQQDLVRCARCGVHLPRAEAHLAAGQLYCGEEHARLGAGER